MFFSVRLSKSLFLFSLFMMNKIAWDNGDYSLIVITQTYHTVSSALCILQTRSFVLVLKWRSRNFFSERHLQMYHIFKSDKTIYVNSSERLFFTRKITFVNQIYLIQQKVLKTLICQKLYQKKQTFKMEPKWKEWKKNYLATLDKCVCNSSTNVRIAWSCCRVSLRR